MTDLALFGGKKVIRNPIRGYNPIGQEELAAATQVIETGVLSKFLGAWSEDFYGGKNVIEFERECEKYFGTKHAVSMNSWTSGLYAAVGAINIEPGDEVIVTPWTMCATATAILQWNAIPVFADIEPDTFNICPQSVEANITEHTRAIIAADIFGHSCDIGRLMELAEKYDLKVITDTAQAPGSTRNGILTGTTSHVGGFSLNYHKHIHTGEGGIVITDDDEIAEKLRLIRNHGEAVVSGMNRNDIVNIIGNNYRLGEIESAIGIQQLRKLDSLVETKQKAAQKLSDQLTGLPGLRTPVIRSNCTHSFYVFPLVLDTTILKIGRSKIVKALEAEGVPGLMEGYANIHLLPLFQNKIAYGSKGFPWNSDICKRDVSYEKGICPIAEHMHDEAFLGFLICMYELSDNNILEIAEAFNKVWRNLNILESSE